MKYFQFTYPYYALIAAETEDKALAIYEYEICDSEDGVSYKQISKDDVIEKWEQAGYELHELVDLMQEENILLIDEDLM